MAESRNNGCEESDELQEFSSSQGMPGYFLQKKHLSIEEIRSKLSGLREISENGERMLFYINNADPHHYQHMQVQFPVTDLQHDTEERDLKTICEDEGFRAKQNGCRPEFNSLSFWSAAVSPDDIESARQQVYQRVRSEHVNAEEYQHEIMGQLCNSPAYNSGSRYGNFRFRFLLNNLLNQYKLQHCDGREPQMRILGTETYKKKIAHYIVVHSPDTESFSEFPILPSDPTGSDPLPFVYRKNGALYWRPESTSEALQVRIPKEDKVRKECFAPCEVFQRYDECDHLENGIFSVWNQLILAFHLPDGLLKIPREKLLNNLSECDTAEPYLGQDPLPVEEAREIIRKLKQKYNITTT